MASVSPEQWQRADTDRKVLDPLQNVRKYIRSYILFETAAIVVILLFLWFWVGLMLDYLPFAFGSFDWLHELNAVDQSVGSSTWIRGIILLVIVGWVGYYLISKLFVRFFKEFSDQSIALVLEKRFPDILGERLITAIQLSDPKIAERYNFSPVMVQRTIEEARERVQRVPVAKVFDWGRLWMLWIWALVATLGVFVVLGGLTMGWKALRAKPIGPERYGWNFYHTAAIFTERNLLMRDSYYPRDTYLEVVRFQDQGHKGEMKIPAEDSRPDLTVRAVEWAVADPERLGGWRGLRLSEVKQYVPAAQSAIDELPMTADFPHWTFDGDDLDDSIPGGVVPDTWNGKSHADVFALIGDEKKLTDDIRKSIVDSMDFKNWTVDKLLLQWKAITEEGKFKEQDPQTFAKIDAALSRLQTNLEEMEASGRHQRTLRRLQVPEQVLGIFRTKDKNSPTPGKPKGEQKYTIETKALDESADITIRGGDYSTPALRLTLIGPPRVTSLVLEKWEPAYLYQRITGNQLQLLGKRQHFRDIDVFANKEISIAQSGDLVLRGSFEKGRKIRTKGFTLFPLAEAGAGAGGIGPDEDRREKWEMPRAAVLAEQSPDEPLGGTALILSHDRTSFRFQAGQVQKKMGFGIEFYDEDNVRGQFIIKIRPSADDPPMFDTVNENVKNIDLAAGLRRPKIKGEGKGQPMFGDGLLITPDANIPFNCNKLADKHGLAEVRWIFEVEPVRFELSGKADDVKAKATRFLLRGEEGPRRASLALSTLQFGPGSGMGNLYSPFYYHLSGQIMESDLKRKDNFSVERAKPLDSFYERLQSIPELPLDRLASALENPIPEKLPHVTTFVMKRDEFDVRKYLPELKVKDTKSEVQLHFQVRLTMELVDTNIETGPGRTRPKSVFTFLVISENELLAQIGQEEEDLRTLLDNQYQKLSDAKVKIQDAIGKLSKPGPDYGFIGIRSGEVRKTLLGSGEETRKATNAYVRILEEMRVNRLSDERIRTVERKIVRPLETLTKTELREDEKVDLSIGNFGLADDAASLFHEGIDKDLEEKVDDRNRDAHLVRAKATLQQLDRVLNQLNNILSAMDDGIDFAKSLEIGLQIERNQRQYHNQISDLHRNWDDILLRFLVDPLK